MVEVRPASEGEYGEVVGFYRELIESMRESEFMPEWEMGVYPTESMLKKAVEKRELYVAHMGDELIGAMILNRECEPAYDTVEWRTDAKKGEIMAIHLLGVARARQGKGVAKRMIAKAAEIGKNDLLKAIRLDVLRKNFPAAKMYESAGFIYIDSVRMYYKDTGLADFLLYELAL